MTGKMGMRPYILLDEGQDTNDVVLDLFLRQRAQRVIVGDEYQAIYGWRGAVNALTQCRDQAGVVLTLTQSFRYGEAIAEVANEILSINPECDFELRGWPERNSTLGDVNGRHTVIARSNAVLVEKALRCIREGKTISVVGGIRDACDQIESIYWLREGELEFTTTAKELYEVYKQWCDRNGEHQETQRSFGMRLTERGLEREKGRYGWSWKGIRVLPQTS
jgi:hypothetical protein